MRFPYLLLVIGIAGCAASRPYAVDVALPATADPLECISAKVATLGYTVATSFPETRSVQATRRDGSFETRLAASVFQEGGVRRLRVMTDVVNHGGRREQRRGSTARTREDAQEVIDACTPS